MRVVHVTRTYFPDSIGGVEEAIRQICLASSLFGIENKIFTLSPQPVPQEMQAPEGEVVRCRSWAAPASCDLGSLEAVRRFGELSQWADVIHYHYPWPYADVLQLLAGRGKPSVMTYHSDIVRQRLLGFFYRPLMRRTVRSMTVVVATSPGYAKTSHVLTHVVPQSRLRMIPLGFIDYAHENTGCINHNLDRLSLDEVPFVLSLGMFRYYKGLHVLIRAAASICAIIVIAGSGPEATSLKRQAKNLGNSNIIFTGQVSRAEKIALIRRCRAFVLPSHLRAEAYAMVLVEAAMFGKPMVSCELNSGTSFVNLHGETGFVVPPESPEALADACNRLILDETLATKMGIAARDRYERLFSGEVLGQAYANLYREIVL